MSRYPYTESADFIRSRVTDFDEKLGIRVPAISRSEASQARQAIALALGMNDEELAKKIADYARMQEGSLAFDYANDLIKKRLSGGGV